MGDGEKFSIAFSSISCLPAIFSVNQQASYSAAIRYRSAPTSWSLEFPLFQYCNAPLRYCGHVVKWIGNMTEDTGHKKEVLLSWSEPGFGVFFWDLFSEVLLFFGLLRSAQCLAASESSNSLLMQM